MSTFHILDFNFIEVQKLLFLQNSDTYNNTYIYMTIYFLASAARLWFLVQVTRNVKHVGSPKRDAKHCYIELCVCKMVNHKCIFHKKRPLFKNLFLEKTPFIVIRHCAQTPHGQLPSFIIGICFEN